MKRRVIQEGGISDTLSTKKTIKIGLEKFIISKSYIGTSFLITGLQNHVQRCLKVHCDLTIKNILLHTFEHIYGGF